MSTTAPKACMKIVATTTMNHSCKMQQLCMQQPWYYCGKWWCNYGKWWPTTTTKHNCNCNTQWPQQPWCNNDATTGNDHANAGRWWCKHWKWCCNCNNQPQPQDTTMTQPPEMMTQLWERRQMWQPTTTSWCLLFNFNGAESLHHSLSISNNACYPSCHHH